MPVRDSTEWQHAQVMRKVVNLDSGTGRKIVCAFSDCERDGYENFKRVMHEHARGGWIDGKWTQGGYLCDAVNAGVFPGLHRTYVYCTERHRAMDHFGMQTWMAEHRNGGVYGYLPTGWQGSML